MSSINIKKVKLVKGGEKLSLVFEDTGDCPADEVKLGKNACHPDLIAGIKKLAVHLAILTEYIPEKNSHKNEEVEKFIVTGYAIGGKEGEEGVVITGYRKRKDERIITLNTPFERFEQDDKTRYILMDQLEQDIEAIKKEVILYLTTGKKAPDAQGSLDFGEDDTTGKPGGKPAGAKVTKMKIATEARGPLDADPEAMDRVKNGDWGNDGKASSGGRKGRQTAANPAGK